MSELFFPDEPLGVVNWRSLQTMCGSPKRLSQYRLARPKQGNSPGAVLTVTWEHAEFSWCALDGNRGQVLGHCTARFAVSTPIDLWLRTMQFVLTGYSEEDPADIWLVRWGTAEAVKNDPLAVAAKIAPGGPCISTPPYALAIATSGDRGEARVTLDRTNRALIEFQARSSAALEQLVAQVSPAFQVEAVV